MKYIDDLKRLNHVCSKTIRETASHKRNPQDIFITLDHKITAFVNYYDDIDHIREPSANLIRTDYHHLINAIPSHDHGTGYAPIGIVSVKKAYQRLAMFGGDGTDPLYRSAKKMWDSMARKHAKYVDMSHSCNHNNPYEDTVIPIDYETVSELALNILSDVNYILVHDFDRASI